MILAIRTDQPQAELILRTGSEEHRVTWQGHRQLSDTILLKIKELLEACDTDLASLEGIIVFKGPGSFTGLRIGVTVANTLAYSQSIPIVGTQDDSWLQIGLDALQTGQDQQVVTPVYGGEPNITKPRK